MRILILGTGDMAAHHVQCFSEIDGVTVVAGVDLDPERLAAFCDRFGIEKRFVSLDAALDWNGFDAVANVTPDRIHYPTTMQCLAAGKHVFCEKPLATNHADALEMTAAAERAGLIGMVNLIYRGVAPLQKAREMVLAGEIGEIKHVEASYLQSWLSQPAWGDWRTNDRWLWRLSTRHGSTGVLGDVGIHIIDFAGFGAALDVDEVYCRLQTFTKAEDNRIGDYQLDANDSFAMSVGFGNRAIGTIHASRWASGHLNELKLRIYGERGGLEVVSLGGARHILDPEYSSLRVSLREDMQESIWRDVPVPPGKLNYEVFADSVRSGRPAEPSFATAARLQQVLDRSFQSGAENRSLPVE